jgi:hypothetical protein
LVFENYNTQTASSGSYLARTGIYVPPGNMTEKGLPRRHIEKLLYWGSDMWYHQHWYRKGLLYVSVLMVGLVLKVKKPFFFFQNLNQEKNLIYIYIFPKLLDNSKLKF